MLTSSQRRNLDVAHVVDPADVIEGDDRVVHRQLPFRDPCRSTDRSRRRTRDRAAEPAGVRRCCRLRRVDAGHDASARRQAALHLGGGVRHEADLDGDRGRLAVRPHDEDRVGAGRAAQGRGRDRQDVRRAAVVMVMSLVIPGADRGGASCRATVTGVRHDAAVSSSLDRGGRDRRDRAGQAGIDGADRDGRRLADGSPRRCRSRRRRR